MINFLYKKLGLLFKATLLTLLLTLWYQSTFSQVTDARVTFQIVSADSVNGIFYLIIPDTLNITEVEIVITNVLEDTIVFTAIYVYDVTLGLPTGISWVRNGMNAELGMGTLPKCLAWQGRVRIKDGMGQWGFWYEFLFD